MRSWCTCRLTVAMTIMTLLLAACSLNPSARKQKYFEFGQQYFQKGQYREAAVEFSKAVNIDANYTDAHLQLARTYLKLRQPDRAYQEYAEVVQSRPDDYQTRTAMTYLLIASHRFVEAKAQTTILLKQRPDDPDSYSMMASLLAGEGNFDGAMGELQKAIALVPNNWQLYLSLALLQLKGNQPDAAEGSFKKAVTLDPTSIQAHILLGNYYESRGHLGEAEDEFRQSIRLNGSVMEPREALAKLLLAEGKKAAASEVLEQAVRVLPNNPESHLALSNFYFVTGNLNGAIAEYSALHDKYPQDMQITKKYIRFLIQVKRYGEASDLDGQILKDAPNDPDALLYRSEIQISEGDASSAILTLQALTSSMPDDSEAHYALGVAFAKKGDLGRAVGEWQETLHENPNSVKAENSIAEAAMEQGDMNTLQGAARRLIVLQPGAPEGYALLALAEINLKELDEAQANIDKAIVIAPQSSFGYVQMGNLRFAQKRFADAGLAYQEALIRNRNSIDALRGLVNTYVAQGQEDKAVAAVRQQIVKSPSNAEFFSLLGTVLFHSKKDLNGAEAALEKSTTLAPGNAEAWIQLCEVQAAKGDINQAIATANRSLKLLPDQARLYILLGNLFEAQSDWSQAESAYQNVLAMDVQNPIASVDLARTLLHTGGSLDTALALAQTARRQLPNSPAAADTLGWIYFQKGMYFPAISSLEDALRLQQRQLLPDNPDIHYHLGMAYEKTKQPSLARQQFEGVLRMDPGYRDAAEIKLELARLKS